MKLRGNYKLFFLIEFLSGILSIFLFYQYGDYGLLGFIPFFVGLILTQKKEPDEREILLSYKINSFEGIIIGTAMAIIYFKFPNINWFYSLVCISMIARGAIGFLTFKFS
ncbi:MAG: hypothetical protein GY936_18790 [Ignavibacteriae bacterium]|nr:hypothetical protein [Ignavibacteriota bacterium]